jgi:ABC-type nitrate/sulfonate/bicarbonate transport system permease component
MIVAIILIGVVGMMLDLLLARAARAVSWVE